MIIIRCDSSFEIGTGHAVRCLHLAKILSGSNYTIEFVCQDLPGNIIFRIEQNGFKVHKSADLEDLNIITKLKPTWIVVDQYSLDKRWEQKARKLAKLFVIDDILRQHDCDVLLDQNFRSDFSDFKNLVPPDCELLVGPKYCLLSPELQRHQPRRLEFSPFEVIVFFGGADERNDLFKFYSALKKVPELNNILCKLVALSSHKHLANIKSLPSFTNCQILIDPQNWHKLLNSSTFFVGSGGTVTWERLYLGLPGAVIAVADNQIAVSEQVAKAGLQYYWGDSKKLNFDQVIQNLILVSQKQVELRQISQKGMQSVDRIDAQKLNKIFT